MDVSLMLPIGTIKLIVRDCWCVGDSSSIVQLCAALIDDRVELQLFMDGIGTDGIGCILHHLSDRVTATQRGNLLAAVPREVLAKIMMCNCDPELAGARDMICSTRELARAALWYAIKSGYGAKIRRLTHHCAEVPRWFPDIRDWLRIAPDSPTLDELRDLEKLVDKVLVRDVMRVVIPCAVTAMLNPDAPRDNPILRVFADRSLSSFIARLAYQSHACVP